MAKNIREEAIRNLITTISRTQIDNDTLKQFLVSHFPKLFNAEPFHVKTPAEGLEGGLAIQKALDLSQIEGTLDPAHFNNDALEDLIKTHNKYRSLWLILKSCIPHPPLSIEQQINNDLDLINSIHRAELVKKDKCALALVLVKRMYERSSKNIPLITQLNAIFDPRASLGKWFQKKGYAIQLHEAMQAHTASLDTAGGAGSETAIYIEDIDKLISEWHTTQEKIGTPIKTYRYYSEIVHTEKTMMHIMHELKEQLALIQTCGVAWSSFETTLILEITSIVEQIVALQSHVRLAEALLPCTKTPQEVFASIDSSYQHLMHAGYGDLFTLLMKKNEAIRHLSTRVQTQLDLGHIKESPEIIPISGTIQSNSIKAIQHPIQRVLHFTDRSKIKAVEETQQPQLQSLAQVFKNISQEVNEGIDSEKDKAIFSALNDLTSSNHSFQETAVRKLAAIKEINANTHYIEILLSQTYPEYFMNESTGEFHIHDGEIARALGWGTSTLKVDATQFNATLLNKLYDETKNPLWLFLKIHTKNRSISKQEILHTCHKLAEQFLNKALGKTNKYAPVLDLVTFAYRMANTNSELTRLVSTYFGTTSSIGKKLIKKIKMENSIGEISSLEALEHILSGTVPAKEGSTISASSSEVSLAAACQPPCEDEATDHQSSPSSNNLIVSPHEMEANIMDVASSILQEESIQYEAQISTWRNAFSALIRPSHDIQNLYGIKTNLLQQYKDLVQELPEQQSLQTLLKKMEADFNQDLEQCTIEYKHALKDFTAIVDEYEAIKKQINLLKSIPEKESDIASLKNRRNDIESSYAAQEAAIQSSYEEKIRLIKRNYQQNYSELVKNSAFQKQKKLLDNLYADAIDEAETLFVPTLEDQQTPSSASPMSDHQTIIKTAQNTQKELLKELFGTLSYRTYPSALSDPLASNAIHILSDENNDLEEQIEDISEEIAELQEALPSLPEFTTSLAKQFSSITARDNLLKKRTFSSDGLLEQKKNLMIWIQFRKKIIAEHELTKKRAILDEQQRKKFEILASVDDSHKTQVSSTFHGLSAESMDPVDKPWGVGLKTNGQQTLVKNAVSPEITEPLETTEAPKTPVASETTKPPETTEARFKALFITLSQTRFTKNSTLVNTVVHLLKEDKNLQEITEKIKDLVQTRKNRYLSKINRDLHIIQPLYDLLAQETELKIDEQLCNKIEKLMYPVHHDTVQKMLGLFKNTCSKDKRHTGIQKMLSIIEKNTDPCLALFEISTIAKQRVHRSLSKMHFFGAGRDTALVQPLYDLLSQINSNNAEEKILTITQLLEDKVSQISPNKN